MNNNIIGNKYKLIKKIGYGNFGMIFEGKNIRTNEKVAIKMELISDNIKLLKNESIIYKLLNGLDGIPNIKWYGKDELFYFMVIDLLGQSLEDLIKIYKKLNIKLILQIGINILKILKNIHDKGFIHRDIKPENFLLTSVNPKKLFIIDFGLCKPYVINGNHIDNIKKGKFVGTHNFGSINAHEYNEQSRRDDLESLSYMLIYFYLGNLEWMEKDLYLLSQEDKNQYIKNKKKGIILNTEIPNVIMDFHKNIINLEFQERPNYEKYIEDFTEEIKRLHYNYCVEE